MAEVPTARADTIDSSELGFTLPVEMVFLVSCEDANTNWPDLSFAAEPEEVRIADAVEKFKIAKQHGVDTIVDRTLPGIGRNVARVKKVAEQVPVNIIVSTGWYTWNDLPFFFAFTDEWQNPDVAPRPSLEDLIVRDLEEGIADTGVRAGIIKCVTDKPGLTDGVTRAIRAAARAHRRTGAPITTHTGMGIGTKSGLLQQGVLEEEGVDLSRVHIGHIDFTPPDVPLDEFMQIMDRGSLISFDTLAPSGMHPPEYATARVERIVELCKHGYADRIMLSGDSACWHDLLPVGTIASEFAYPTYTHVPLGLLPTLRERGVSEAHIEQMMVKNPRRLLETRSNGGY